MTIFPATDLVVDVGRAADPAKRADALHRLERFSANAPEAGAYSNAELSSLIHRNQRPSAQLSLQSRTTASIPTPIGKDESAAAFKKFEAFLLQTWLEVLLPGTDGGAYGHDNAGGVWRSLMAEQLGDQLAKNDSMGIGRLLAQSNTQTRELANQSRIDFALRKERT